MSVTLYNSANCPCPSDCKRRGNCRACIEFHHARNERTYCEFLADKLEKAAPPSETPVKSGRELRLLDYGPCAG
ncbi:hypothetical protein JXO52_06035 [bacterium]|nr:hypothetical protein [bacterium]